MSSQVIVRREALLDITAAHQYYEVRRPGLGDQFLLCVDAAIERARRSPEMYPVVHRNVRRALTRRFPYAIFYVVEPDRIVVLGVFHARRDPDNWQARE